MAKQEVDKMKFVQDLEVEMMSDMYSKSDFMSTFNYYCFFVTNCNYIFHYIDRMMLVCHDKCISKKYTEPDVSKGEAVCLDRCVAKFLEIHDRVGRKLTQLTVQDEEMMKRMQSPA